MGEYELGIELRKMYDSAPSGDQVAAIHLFAIRFWKEISGRKLNKKLILQAASLPESYATEISKGAKLGRYVTINEKAMW